MIVRERRKRPLPNARCERGEPAGTIERLNALSRMILLNWLHKREISGRFDNMGK